MRLDIAIEEDLKERQLVGDEYVIAKEQFHEAKRKVYADWDYAFPGGESSRQAQERAAAVLDRLLEELAGRTIAIGTYGDIMTLMMNRFDPRYDFAFWESTTMPDIYRLQFERHRLVNVQRRWA